MVLSLPPIPPELKPITPYLQRADELATNDPVISYWCAYFAAQQGIALKVKDSPARHFLFDLLGLLERLKTDLGSNDAVHDEPASAAYIENFALRVFAGADNEDRSGNITRNTARKFVAAANFLELLRIFDTEKTTTDLPSIEEKIKYAKWKAADIAKAFREGRKPTPGPAGSEPIPESPPAAPEVPDVAIVPPPDRETTTQTSSLPSPPAITRSIPPLLGLPSSNLPDGLAPSQHPQTPGSWSTLATPGTPEFRVDDTVPPADLPEYAESPRRAFVSRELEGKPEGDIDGETTPPASAAKSVHFSPSTVGGIDAARVSAAGGPGDFFFDPNLNISSLQSPSAMLPGYATPSTTTPGLHLPRSLPSAVPPAAPPLPGVTNPRLEPATATVTTMPVEMTPQTIARIQKHCRYAISALDYEDIEQAEKELRAALNMLGRGT